MNTRIDYLYRDAGNYKVYNTCVVGGEAGRLQQTLIREACLPEQDQFIPSRVGLPEERFPSWSEDDTVFFELEDITLTEDEATVPIDIEELAFRFQTMQDHWFDQKW